MAGDRGILRLMTRSPHDAATPPDAAAAPPVEPPARADAAPPTAPAETAPAETAPSEAARAKAEKAIRLAAALRANLRRRKAPARTAVAPKGGN